MTITENPKKKKNHYISYIKGFALIFIVLVHLVHWSNIKYGNILHYFMEISSIGILLFMSMIGVVIIFAYGKYTDIKRPAKRLTQRALLLLGIYFLYNIVKYYLFPLGLLAHQPFYWQFTERGTMDLISLLTLKSFTVPITVFVLIPILLIVSIGVLYINKMKYKKTIIGALIAFFYILNYWTPASSMNSLNFLYGINTSMLSINYWLLPYFVGVLVAMFGFEKIKYQALLIFGGLTAIFYFQNSLAGNSLNPSENIYPMKAYYVAFSFFVTYIIIFIIQAIESLKNHFSHSFLAFINFLGNHTFNLYIYHWIVIDLTIWFISDKAILIVVPAFIALYSIYHYKKIKDYYFEIREI
ncbi:MAG: hypothetical protein PHG82_03075 [Candidatus Gracilibacteria bacterium]|nr:hypothetical protein [Candidatus Gracilibacteria bacterium]